MRAYARAIMTKSQNQQQITTRDGKFVKKR